MPNLPMIQAQRAERGMMFQQPQARNPLFGTLSQGLGQLGQQAAARDRQAEKEAMAGVNQLLSTADEAINEISLNLQKSSSWEEYPQKLDEQITDYYNTLDIPASGPGAEMWKEKSHALRMRYGKSADTWSAQEEGKAAVTAEVSAASTDANRLYNDPSLYEEMVGRLEERWGARKGSMPEDAWESYLEGQKYTLANRWATGKIIGTTSSDQAKAVLSELEGEVAQGRIKADEYPSILNSARKRYADLLKAEDESVTKTKADALFNFNMRFAELNEQVEAGIPVTAELEQLFSFATGNKIASAPDRLARLKAANSDVLKDYEAQIRTAGAMTGHAAINPSDERDIKAVDTLYEGAQQRFANDPEGLGNFAKRIVTSTGVVPKALKAQISAGMNSPNPNMQVTSAIMLNSLRNSTQSPSVWAAFNDDEFEHLNQILALTASGATPEETMDHIQRVRSVPNDVRKQRLEAADSYFKKDNFPAVETAIKDLADDGHFGGIDDFPPEFWSAFKARYRASMVNQGSHEVAMRTAADQLNRTWGRSSIGFAQGLSHNPIEKVYGIPGWDADENADWIGEQIKTAIIESDLGRFQDRDDVDMSKFLITPHPTLSRRTDGKPVYQISELREGGWYIYEGMFAPDVGMSSQYQQQQADFEEFKKRAERGEIMMSNMRQTDERLYGGVDMASEMWREKVNKYPELKEEDQLPADRAGGIMRGSSRPTAFSVARSQGGR